MKKPDKTPAAARQARTRRASAPKSVSWSVRYVAAKPGERIRSSGCSFSSGGCD